MVAAYYNNNASVIGKSGTELPNSNGNSHPDLTKIHPVATAEIG